MATGTRLFQVERVIREKARMVQGRINPEDDMFRENAADAAMLITLTRQSHIIILLMPVISFLPIMTAETELTMTVIMKITTNVHRYSVSWFTVTAVFSSNFLSQY